MGKDRKCKYMGVNVATRSQFNSILKMEIKFRVNWFLLDTADLKDGKDAVAGSYF